VLSWSEKGSTRLRSLPAGERARFRQLAENYRRLRHLIGRGVLNRLAERYPTPREKEEVPVWLYLASELTLKLHGSQAYHAFPRVLRSGGLIDALGPKLGGRKATHPETHDVTLACPGFNRKNDYDRQTPCDQDFLRKFARDTEVDRLHAWFNRETPRCLRSLRLLDDEGLFIGDGSYLFVPDNERYEESDLLWFDEHNHPVDPDQVDLRDKRYQRRRCYKLVSLIHVNRQLDFFFTAAARIVPGRRHECPVLYELVDELAAAVGRDVVKVLILDRSSSLPPGCSFPSPRTRREARILLIVRMSSDRLFLDRVGCHQSPSPLHRHEQSNTHLSKPRPKGDISTLRRTRHFYFALTQT
jgi:hypothetical protein